MTRLSWSTAGQRFYEAGVDQGVLYLEGQPGVSWLGLTSVDENPSGGEPKSYYIDGVKYLNVSSTEEYGATINAYTYPDQFSECDGTSRVRNGLYLTQQRRKSFGFSYRTKVGNDLSGVDKGYKIHIVYNALASPSQKTNKTIGDSPEPTEFSWEVTTKPPAISGYRRTSHVVIDSREADPLTISAVEDILYGTESTLPRLPSFDELIHVFDSITTMTVVDHGDGSFTVTAPDSAIKMLDETLFEITWPTAIFIDENSYTISSS